MDPVELTRKLVSIPSYVENGRDERAIGEFILNYLGDLGYLQVKKQEVEEGRSNIIAHDGYSPRLMFCCHMDTVSPSRGWKYDPFGGEIDGNHLYGLGAADMKGGTASLLHALISFHHTKGLWLLFDVDEESYFKGMRAFLERYEVRPELAVFPEPGLKIRNGHRGLIEIHFQVRGVTGHASQPDEGKNSIWGATEAVKYLTERLQAREFSDPILGKSTCNLSFLMGGLCSEDEQECKTNILKSPNRIPDIAEVVIDIRPATKALNAQVALDILNSYIVDSGFHLEKVEKKLDQGPLFVPRERLGVLETVVKGVLGKVEYPELDEYDKFGYTEAQMLNERLGINCVSFGPGPGEMAHGVDEYVSIDELGKASEVYRMLIETYCST